MIRPLPLALLAGLLAAPVVVRADAPPRPAPVRADAPPRPAPVRADAPPSAEPPPAGEVSPPAPSSPPPAASALDEGRRHFEQGVALYQDGDFQSALGEFEASLRANPAPGVLYNVGLTQKMLFRYTEAIETLSRYLAEADPRPGRRAEVERVIAEMQALLAEVTLTVRPAGAQVLVDGRLVGAAPLRPLRLPTGLRVVEVQAEGHRPARRELRLAAGLKLALSIDLAPLSQTGRLRVRAQPASANVTVDGAPALGAPLDLSAGGHTLLATAPGHEPYRLELVVAAGQDRLLDVRLSPARTPLYKRWWPWTIGAVLVGGAVATAVAVSLTTAQPTPLSGTLSPGNQKVF